MRAFAMSTYSASPSMPKTEGHPAWSAPIISDPAPENGTMSCAFGVGGMMSRASHRVRAIGFNVGWLHPVGI